WARGRASLRPELGRAGDRWHRHPEHRPGSGKSRPLRRLAAALWDGTDHASASRAALIPGRAPGAFLVTKPAKPQLPGRFGGSPNQGRAVVYCRGPGAVVAAVAQPAPTATAGRAVGRSRAARTRVCPACRVESAGDAHVVHIDRGGSASGPTAAPLI